MNFGLEERTLDMLRSVFARFGQVDEVIIYGSRAKGNHSPGSDIDLVVKGRDLSLSLLHDLSREIDDLLLPYSVDISLFDHITHPNLLDHIQRVGQHVYTKPQTQ